MTTGHGRLPAGWYRDPVGMHVARYWDGAHWTRETKDAWDGDEELHSLVDVWRTRSDTGAREPDAGQIIDLRNIRPVATDGNGNGQAVPSAAPQAHPERIETEGQTMTKVALSVDLDVTEAKDLFAERPIRMPAPTADGNRGRNRQGTAAPMMRAGRLARLVAAVGIFLVDVALYLKLRSG